MNTPFKSKIILIIFSLSFLFIFTGCRVNSIVDNTRVLKKEDAKEFTIKKERVEQITEIDIDTRIADIELIPSDHYYVEISYNYWDDEPEYTLKNGILQFNDQHAIPNSYSINFNLDNHIKVYLPKDAALKQIRLNSSSGDITAAGFTTDILNTNVSYGDLLIKDATAISSDIRLSSGSSELKDFSTGNLDYKNSYGNADFININSKERSLPDHQIFDTFNITMSSGKITINKLNCKSIDLRNSYGDISCDKLVGDKFDSNLSSGDLTISNSDLKTITTNNSYGDVTFRLFGSEHDYNMDLNTSYGVISVNEKIYDDKALLENNGDRNIYANLSSGDIQVKFKK